MVTAVAVLGADDTPLVLSARDAAEVTARVVAVGTLFTALGAIVGFLVRSQQAATVAIFGSFFAEKLLADLLEDASQYLPFAFLSQLLDAGGSTALSAGLGLAGLTAALGALATMLLVRRDLP